MADDVEFIRQLLQESQQLPPMSRMERSQAAWGAMGKFPWSVRAKSNERVESDRRAAYVLKRLNDRYKAGTLRSVQGVDPDFLNGLADAADAYGSNPEAYNSIYEPTSGSHPLYNAAMWAQSMPSAIYATGQMVGNEVHKAMSDERSAKHVPFPNAYDDYAYSINTLTGGATEGTILPKNQSYWRDVVDIRDSQERLKPRGLMPSGAMDPLVAEVGHQQRRQLLEGEKFLKDSQVPASAAKYLGPALDAAIDLPSSFPTYMALAKTKPVRALGSMIGDYAKSAPHLIAENIAHLSKGKLPWEE